MKYGGARRAVNACGTTDKLAGQLITLTSELDAEISTATRGHAMASQSTRQPLRASPLREPPLKLGVSESHRT